MGNQSSGAASASVLSSTVPLRRHVPLSQRGVPLAMGFFKGMLITITKQQLVQFERRNPVEPSAHYRTVSGQNGFTAACLTFSHFFKAEIAILATRENKLSVFDLTELNEVYTLDVGGGAHVTSLISQKLSDTFWLGFSNGCSQCWTFGDAACKAKYFPPDVTSPVLKLDFSRNSQLLFVLHEEHPLLRVYTLLEGTPLPSLTCDRSQQPSLLENVSVTDFAVVESQGLVVLLGSIANVISVYEMAALSQQAKAGESQGLFECAPALQYFARYEGISDKILMTSLCVAKLDDMNTSEREYSLKVIKAKRTSEEEVLRKVILLFGLQNGSVLSSLLYREDSSIRVDAQQFYKPKGAVLMIGDHMNSQHKLDAYAESGFVPPVLHIKKMSYSLQNDVLLASNQGCMVNILPGVRGAVERAQLGKAPLIEQPRRLPLFSVEPTVLKPKVSEKQPKKKLKLLSLGEKNDEKVKSINWKGLVTSMKNIVKRQKKEPPSEEKKHDKEQVEGEADSPQQSEEQQQAQEFKVMEILSRYSKQMNIQDSEIQDKKEEGEKEGEKEEGEKEEGEKGQNEGEKERSQSEDVIELE